MKKLQKAFALGASICGFLFGCMSLYYFVVRHDAMLMPFMFLGFIASVVMYANSKD